MKKPLRLGALARSVRAKVKSSRSTATAPPAVVPAPSPDPAPTTAPASGQEEGPAVQVGARRRILLWSLVGSVVVAAISAGSALVGSRIGAQATLESSNQQVQAARDNSRREVEEARSQETREKRAKVYADYLLASEKYSIATGTFLAKIRERPKASGGGQDYTWDPAALSAYLSARNAWQDQVNQVYVYGSDEGWAAHQIMAGVLPPALGTLKFKQVDSAKFLAAYQGLQTVFCREAAAIPRSGCGEH